MPPGSTAGLSITTWRYRPTGDRDPVRRFKTLTPHLAQLIEWLQACHVAMEATGVYWIPLYEMLEARGFEVVLVNARHVKNVPGRKTDVIDCQWLQELHSVGLLRGSFRPSADLVSLRAYLWHQETLVQDAATHVRRIQKALVQMNVQLHHVITDITGETGMRIVRDIARGVTDPGALAAHRNYRCRASEDEIAASLTGNYRPEHVFALRQNLDLYDSYQRQIGHCDEAIESLLRDLASEHASPEHVLSTGAAAAADQERTALRDSQSPPPPLQRGSHTDRFHRAVYRPAAHRRDRHRHDTVAQREALHVLADPRAQEQDHRRASD